MFSINTDPKWDSNLGPKDRACVNIAQRLRPLGHVGRFFFEFIQPLKMHCHCLQDAEQSGYTAEDIQVSLNHCGDVNPVSWLRENWDNMMDTVVTLASNVGHEAEENTIGTLSKIEAKEALRKHKGNIWAAVTECVEQRQMRVSFCFAIPPASEASREVENFDWRKKHTPTRILCQKFVCLSVCKILTLNISELSEQKG